MTAPVPAMPDLPRVTTYSVTNSVGPFDVGFDIWGDGSDFDAWVSVSLNGAELAPYTDWTLASPTGPFAELTRPITDAQITLTAPMTGTLSIVGALRPRRTAQFDEGRGVGARDFNAVITKMMAIIREQFDRSGRIEATLASSLDDPIASTAAVLTDRYQSFTDVEKQRGRRNIDIDHVAYSQSKHPNIGGVGGDNFIRANQNASFDDVDMITVVSRDGTTGPNAVTLSGTVTAGDVVGVDVTYNPGTGSKTVQVRHTVTAAEANAAVTPCTVSFPGHVPSNFTTSDPVYAVALGLQKDWRSNATLLADFGADFIDPLSTFLLNIAIEDQPVSGEATFYFNWHSSSAATGSFAKYTSPGATLSVFCTGKSGSGNSATMYTFLEVNPYISLGRMAPGHTPEAGDLIAMPMLVVGPDTGTTNNFIAQYVSGIVRLVDGTPGAWAADYVLTTGGGVGTNWGTFEFGRGLQVFGPAGRPSSGDLGAGTINTRGGVFKNGVEYLSAVAPATDLDANSLILNGASVTYAANFVGGTVGQLALAYSPISTPAMITQGALNGDLYLRNLANAGVILGSNSVDRFKLNNIGSFYSLDATGGPKGLGTGNFHTGLWVDNVAVPTVSSTDTLTNKTLTSPTINGGTLNSATGLSIRSTGAAFDLQLVSAEVMTANRALTIALGNATRSLTLSGNPTLGDWFDQSVKQAASPTFKTSVTLSGATSGTGTLRVAAAAGTGTIFELPATNGTSGQVLKTDGAGVTSWQAQSGILLCGASGGAASTAPLTTGGTLYFASSGGGINAASQRNTLPVAGTMRNLRVTCATPGTGPGGTETYTFTLQKNGVDTAITCQMTGSGLVASDTTHTVTFAAGDTWQIKAVSSAAAANNAYFGFGIEFTTP